MSGIGCEREAREGKREEGSERREARGTFSHPVCSKVVYSSRTHARTQARENSGNSFTFTFTFHFLCGTAGAVTTKLEVDDYEIRWELQDATHGLEIVVDRRGVGWVFLFLSWPVAAALLLCCSVTL